MATPKNTKGGAALQKVVKATSTPKKKTGGGSILSKQVK